MKHGKVMSNNGYKFVNIGEWVELGQVGHFVINSLGISSGYISCARLSHQHQHEYVMLN